MGFSKLNVWLRDEQCKPFQIDKPTQHDWVKIKHCTGELVKKVTFPAGQAHVEIEVPPGCYKVKGHVCQRGTNEHTDEAMVIVGCNQVSCVNLIVPNVKTCARNDLVAILDVARRLDLPNPDIIATARTIMRIGDINRDTLIAELDSRIESVKAVERIERLEDYQGVKRIIQSIK
jgi:hypothetical protein